MKIKEYCKINQDIRNQRIEKYCADNNIDYKEYKKAEKKNNRIFVGVCLGLVALMVGASICCAFKGNSNEVEGSNYSQPLLAEKNYANEVYEDTIKIINYTDSTIQFEYNYPSDSTIYNYSIGVGETYYANVNFGSYNHVYLYAPTSVYYLSDDIALNDYGQTLEFVCENFNGSYIQIFDNYGANFNDTVYLDLTGDFTPQSMNVINVVGEVLPTNVQVTKNIEIPFSTNGSYFHLDFVDDYVNFPNNFNKLEFEYSIRPNGYSYNWVANVYAKSSNVRVLIASTYEVEYPIIAELTEGGIRQLGIAVDGNAYAQSGAYYTYGQYFRLAPYLNSTKLVGTFGNYNNNRVIGMRSLVRLDYKQLVKYVVREYTVIKNQDIWDRVGDLFLVTFTSLMPIASIQILPFVSIGALMFAPFAVAFVMLILRLIKK